MRKGYCYETQIGLLCFVEEDGILTECTQTITNNMVQEETECIKKAASEVYHYLKGELKDFTTSVSLTGTPFQRAVYQALQTVPYGETISYKELAEKIGKPKSYRAVGNAMNKNPLMLFVPCHRVIKTDTSIGGFALPVEVKQHLLNLEGARVYA